MSLFNPIRSKSYSETLITPTFIPLDWLSNYLANVGDATDDKFLKFYLSVPELQAIINYRGRVFGSMRVKAFDASGKEIDIPQLKVFKKPNPLQNFKEFAMQYHVLRDIFGNEFIHPIFGVDPSMTATMWNLPPMDAEIIPAENKIIPFNTTELKEIIKEYHFKYDGQTIKYQPIEIIHFNDNQVRFDKNRFLLGDSKLRPLIQPCENIKSAYEARGVLIQNSALGILSNVGTDQAGTVPMNPDDKDQLHEDYKKYGLTKNKWNLIITNASLKWQSMAVKTGDLKLFEEVDSDFRTIAGQYNFPPELLQPKSGSSLNQESKNESLKQFYQDSMIPESDEWLQEFANFFGLENITLKSDWSHVPALQDDIELRSKSINWAATGLSKAKDSGLIAEAEAQEEFKKFLS